jgi:ABC-2 type transport system permease protein
LNDTSPEQVVNESLLAKYNATQFIEIPSGFTDDLNIRMNNDSSVRAHVNFYSIFSGVNPFAGLSSSLIDGIVTQFNREWAPDLLTDQKSVIIKGQIAQNVDPAVLSSLLLSQAIAMPITILILLTYSMQIAATSVAMEKEEKTLETLLTLPMDRFSILMGKLSGSILVAAVGALAYVVGFTYYMGSITSSIPTGPTIDLASLGLVPTFLGYLLLGASLFVTLLSALALAVIVSAFAEDVRSAQSLIGYVYPLIFLPTFVLMYIDINSLPLALRTVLYAIPFSHPAIASKAIIIGDYSTAIFGIAYVAIFTVVVMYVASRLFATEKILTAKLKFRGLRGRRKQQVQELE